MMSRTDKTMPLRLQEEDGTYWWHTGGVWRGIKERNQKWHRQKRAAAKRAMRRGDTPDPILTRGSVKWDMY